MTKKSKSLMYTLLLFFILAAPLFYLSSVGMDSITGMATSDGKRSEIKVGEYSISPDFSVIPTDDLNSYEKMRIDADELRNTVRECEQNQDLETCLESTIASLDGWSTECGDVDERFLIHFVEDYLSCSGVDDDYCYCKVPRDQPEEFIDKYLTFENKDEGLYFKTGEEEYTLKDQKIYTNSNTPGHLTTQFAAYPLPNINLPAHLFNQKLIIQKGDLFQNQIKNKKELPNIQIQNTIYKIGYEIIFLSVGEFNKATSDANNEEALEFRECRYKEKRIYRFCVDSGKKVFAEEDGEIDSRPLIYQFAIDFSDSVAPPQTEFTISDFPKDKQSLALSWSHSSEPDFDHYNIYVSVKEFDNLNEMYPQVEVEDPFYKIDEIRIMNTVSKIKDDTDYYITVVPVDKSGNHLFEKEDIKVKVGRSIDDN